MAYLSNLYNDRNRSSIINKLIRKLKKYLEKGYPNIRFRSGYISQDDLYVIELKNVNNNANKILKYLKGIGKKFPYPFNASTLSGNYMIIIYIG